MVRSFTVLLAAIGMCVPRAWAFAQYPVTVEFTGEPSYPDQNRLKNAGLSVHEGDKVKEWSFRSAVMDNFSYGWRDAISSEISNRPLQPAWGLSSHRR
ncbi:MAG: hypothetical protein HY318_01315 [Armatimonadetes bacterium]|nr:hypothetical protein [Armatimonadota bacterium]